METYFISNQTLKDYSFLDDNIDEKSIKVALLDVQETMLQPLIGTNLYEKLSSGIRNGDLGQDYLKLLDTQIKKCLIHGTMWKLAINLVYRYTNSSISKDSNANSTAISIQELNVLRQERESSYNYHAKALTDFMTINQSKFPEYFNVRLGDISPETVQNPINFFYED